jgi:hypothetical protein
MQFVRGFLLVLIGVLTLLELVGIFAMIITMRSSGVLLGLLLIQVILFVVPARFDTTKTSLLLTGLIAVLLIGGLAFAAILALSDAFTITLSYLWIICPLIAMIPAGIIFSRLIETREPSVVAAAYILITLMAMAALVVCIGVPAYRIANARENNMFAGLASFLGMGAGIVVFVLALGPALLLLYHRLGERAVVAVETGEEVAVATADPLQ